jgi:UDP-GlcNAc:undecaprenyl-phosphate GlcNAc-1-phosphate transferase
MTYLIITVLLFTVILLYFKIADQYNIIDKPNERSSHKHITIRGGGVLFPIGIFIWFLLFGFNYPWFIIGLLLIATISFVDDRLTLSTKPRLLIHLVSVGLMLYELGFFSLPWFIWLIGFVLVIGWLNAFNFMDGINGITTFYALAVLLPLWYLNLEFAFIETDFLYVCGLSLLVFAFFNARKKAKTFAGDVGSISMGFILAFTLIALVLKTSEFAYILLVATYGIDAVLTIVQRLIKGENIFKAHRSHLYQYLANEKGWSHISVSTVYAFLQLVISAVTIYLIHLGAPLLVFVLILVVLALTYWFVKNRIVYSILLKS